MPVDATVLECRQLVEMQTRALLQHEKGVTKAAQVGLDRRDAVHTTAVVLVVPWRIWLDGISRRQPSP